MNFIFLTNTLNLVFLFTVSNGIPVLEYNPSYYYGPMINEPLFTEDLAPEGWEIGNRNRRQSDDAEFYEDSSMFSSPEFQYIIPSYNSGEEMMASPQLHTALEAYFRESYGPHRDENYDTDAMYPLMSIPSGSAMLPERMSRRSLSPLKSSDSPKEDELEDYDYADVDSVSPTEADPEGRRTFSLIGGMIMDLFNGAGGQGETSVEYENQMRAQQQQAELLRQVQETSRLEQLKTQSTLDSLRQETNENTLRNKAQADSLRSQISRLAEQRDSERREKESVVAQIQRETRLREAEREELKRKLEMEATLRERENMNFQQKLQQEAAMRDIERFKMQKDFELEKAKLDLEMKNKLDMESTLEMKKKELEAEIDFKKRMEVESMMQNNVMKSSYESMMNQHTIDNYRYDQGCVFC